MWRGESPDKVSGGHSLLNWPTTCLPKTKGGLGILDLERFTRALRLRWLKMAVVQMETKTKGMEQLGNPV